MRNGLINSEACLTAIPQSDRAAQQIRIGPILAGEKPAVFLVGGHDLAFEGLKTLLIKHSFDVVGVGERLNAVAVPAAAGARRSLVIVDVADGIVPPFDEILLFRRDFPHACIVALVDGSQKTLSLLHNNMGVNAIVDRNIACDVLIKALNVVMSGYGVLSPIIRSDAEARLPGHDAEALKAAPDHGDGTPSSLSEREIQIIGCIAEGQSNKVIARRFSISEATVKIHVRSILRKIDVRNRTQAAIWAIHRGFGASLPLD